MLRLQKITAQHHQYSPTVIGNEAVFFPEWPQQACDIIVELVTTYLASEINRYSPVGNDRDSHHVFKECLQ